MPRAHGGLAVSSIEDFTGDLYKGKKEVFVPKEKVTELSPDWYVSKLNLPHKGSKGALRNGRLHAHDMGDYYAVHLDRRDPKDSSIGHLIEDAPLMLFLWTGFHAAIFVAEDDAGRRIIANRSLVPMILIGLGLLAIGFLITLNQFIALGIIVIATLIGFLVLGAVFIWHGVVQRAQRRVWPDIVIGLISISLSIVIIYYPKFALALLVLAMVIWTLGSAFFLIFGRGEKLLFDQGSLVPLLIGLISLGLGLLLIFSPYGGLSLLITLAGLLLAFMGSMQLISALLILRSAKKERELAPT